MSGDPVLDTLKNVFGYQFFREGQREIIDTIWSNEPVIVMPTGGGKTLCFAIPAVLSGGVTVVVTPLMADQVQRLNELNVCYLNSKMKDDEKEVVLHCLSEKECPYQFFFTTPETLCTAQMKGIIKKMKENNNLARLIVDEAHCVDIWGNDFRPSYSELHFFKESKIQIVDQSSVRISRHSYCRIAAFELIK